MAASRNKIYLIFTFTLTWLLWWILAYLTQAELVDLQSGLGQALFITGGSAPTIGAYVAVILTKKEGSLKEFHSRVLKVRVNYKFYIFAILVPVGLGIIGLAMASILDSQYLHDNPIQPIFLFIPFFFVSILMGGLEEFGWRGVLQPSLQNRLNMVLVNFVIGITWALWHLPLFYISGSGQEGNPFFLYALAAIGFSAFMTWLYAKTSSIFLCVLFHASINATAITGLSVIMEHSAAYTYTAISIFAAGLLFLLISQGKSKQPKANTGGR